MRYLESMPLTSGVRVGEHILIGGGGGNPIFGFPNRMSLLDSDFNVVCEKSVKEVIVSIRVHCGAYAIVEYPSSHDLFTVESGQIKGPVPLPAGIVSPVIVGEFLYYVRDGRVLKASVRGLVQACESSESHVSASRSNSDDGAEVQGGSDAETLSRASDSAVQQPAKDQGSDLSASLSGEGAGEKKSYVDAHSEPVELASGVSVRSLYTDGDSLLYRTCKNDVPLLHTESGRAVMLDGAVSSYSMNKSFAHIIQLGGDESLVTMTHKGSTWSVLEPMCVTVHSTGDGSFYVGTGLGDVISYKCGREMWRKRIFKSPVSSISSQKGALFCTCINGLLSRVSREGAARQILKSGLFYVGVSACVGAAGYYARAQAQSLLSQASLYAQALFSG
ncbi:uncharacterized protein NEMAJ01_0069 [Nematocida major]|uniref:uncharacterized protein n=1 Tax=Nematocida major TaxID=1912982 RepID=UPI002008C4B4|nr:uncharacterized protein NEMAJ01_0069 [Nematocida major]KAH9385173.1 hypothetical protein NEMAJ01_0069 [Nematocida major]